MTIRDARGNVKTQGRRLRTAGGYAYKALPLCKGRTSVMGGRTGVPHWVGGGAKAGGGSRTGTGGSESSSEPRCGEQSRPRQHRVIVNV